MELCAYAALGPTRLRKLTIRRSELSVMAIVLFISLESSLYSAGTVNKFH